MDFVFPIFILGCCFAGILLVAVVVGVIYSRRKEDTQVSVNIEELAKQMGLMPLDSQHPHRFGGTHQGHAFYIDWGTSGTRTMSGMGSIRRAVAVSLEVQMREPRQGYAYCNRGMVSSTSKFEAAFSAKLQYEWLSESAREAMLAFVRKREDLFLEGLPIHPKPGVESKVRLQHNIPNRKQIDSNYIYNVLDELLEAARVIETTC